MHSILDQSKPKFYKEGLSHNHAANFIVYILKGGYYHDTYELLDSNTDGAEVRRKFVKLGGKTEFRDSGEELYLKPIKSDNLEHNQGYYINTSIFHRLRKSNYETRSIILRSNFKDSTKTTFFALKEEEAKTVSAAIDTGTIHE